jgi:tol-pal system protein YbgF
LSLPFQEKNMTKSISVYVALFAVLLMALAAPSSGQEKKRSLAIGANIGLQYPFCDIDPAGAGFAGEGQLRFLISDRFNLALGLGYGQLNDGMTKRTFYTNIINADLKGNLYLLKKGKFRPYATLGFGTINHTYYKDKKTPSLVGDPALEGKAFWDTAYILGGGFDFYLSKSIAVTAMADYRFTSTDELDGYSDPTYSQAKDGYLNGRIGLVFFMGEKQAKPAEELIAGKNTEPSVSTEVAEPMDEETAAILRNLGAIDESDNQTPVSPTVATTAAPTPDATPTPTTAAAPVHAPSTNVAEPELQQLQLRAQELQSRINERENDITSMQSQIQSKDARIAELQRELSQVQQYPADFSATYQEGLRNFGAKNYDRSIDIFTNLRNASPQHKLASNCIYWVGESQFAKGNYQDAVNAFSEVLNYSQSYKKDDATLMLGRCYQRLGQADKAKSYFQRVVSEYPDSEYVPKAQAWLQRLP